MTSDRANVLAQAKDVVKKNPTKAEALYKQVLAQGKGENEGALRDQETALIGLGELYRDQKKPKELAELLKIGRTSFSSFAKAKSAKLGECGVAYIEEQES